MAQAICAGRWQMNAAIVRIDEASLRLRGYLHRLSDPRTTAFRCGMHLDRLDPWSAIFVRDLPSQRRAVSIPQHRALQAIVARLEGLVP
jgi:hypothetical protein